MRCRPIYDAAEEALPNTFRAGYMTGQAEKVALGACAACMFRPPPEEREETLRLLHNIINFMPVTFFEIGDEMWVVRAHPGSKSICRRLSDHPGDHAYRAALCGVPPNEIEVDFFGGAEADAS